jgi:membrane dipeptidase
VSHLNATGFRDVVATTEAPVVGTHSAVHAICPIARNPTDWRIDAIGASGGIVGVNFEVNATRPDGYDEPDTPLGVIVDHIDYLVNRIEFDHVGFGSDFDEATMPATLADAAGLPRLIYALRDRGHDDPAIAQVAWGNRDRVLEATWHG